MRLRVVLLALAAVALIAAVTVWWLRNHERVVETTDLPRTGEATHPLFALRVALEADGFKARTWRRLDLAELALTPRDTLLIDGDPRDLADGEVEDLLAFVRGGGSLVVSTPPFDAAVDTLARSRDADAQSLDVPLLDALDVRVALSDFDEEPRENGSCIVVPLGGRAEHVEFCRARRFDTDRETRLRWRDAQGDAWVRIGEGRGQVDVLAGVDFLRTGDRSDEDDGLRHAAHAAMTRHLVAGFDRGGTVHLVQLRALPPLWRWLLVEGWRIWLPLALLLAGWLWARAQRFGPVHASPVRDRRSLLEHVNASGEHQWRYGDAHTLYEAMRDAFMTRLRRRDPHGAALGGQSQVDYLADRLRLPPARIVDALTPPDPRDAKAFVDRIALLVRMGTRL